MSHPLRIWESNGGLESLGEENFFMEQLYRAFCSHKSYVKNLDNEKHMVI